MEHLSHFAQEFRKALRNLLPIVAVVVAFQLLVFRRMPEDPLQLVAVYSSWEWASPCSSRAWT